MNASHSRRPEPSLLQRGVLGYKQHRRQLRDDINAIHKAMRKRAR